MTKRNYFSKIVAVLMAVLLAFGTLSITAFAAITPTTTGSIKVDGIADVDNGATVTAYKLMRVDVDTTTNTPKDPLIIGLMQLQLILKLPVNRSALMLMITTVLQKHLQMPMLLHSLHSTTSLPTKSKTAASRMI